MEYKIPLAVPDLAGNERKYVLDAIDSSWISSSGKYVQQFERQFADLCASQAAIAVCNGTVALHLALLTLDVRPGDEVIVPSLTYIATANAVRFVGAEPVFVDIDPQTWCLDPTKIEEAITPRTKGIIPVHVYGHPADMDAINHIAAVHGLWVVEDAAEATLAQYKGRPTGSMSKIAAFSFHATKVFTSGEGGALTMSDAHLELRARTLRNHGVVDPKRRYFFPVTGYNFRLTNIACAILCGQLERAEAILERRRQLFALYRELLQNVPGIGLQPVAPWASLSPWLFPVTIDEKKYGRSRSELMSMLEERGIETRPFFIPLHQLPPFREVAQSRHVFLPVTERLAPSGINLPVFGSMENSAVRQVAQAIIEGRK